MKTPKFPKPNPEKIDRIISVLKEHPEGLWVMEISRLTGIPKTTVHRYLKTYLRDFVEEVNNFSGLLICYRLKAHED